MRDNQLQWQSLLPDITPYQTIFDKAAQLNPVPIGVIQSRLASALELFCHPQSPLNFMMLKAEETTENLALIAGMVQQLHPHNSICNGSRYVIQSSKLNLTADAQNDTLITSSGKCLFREWVETEQLFGCVRLYNNEIKIQPGLLHKANGGVLILSAHALVAQPLIWFRMKQMITQREFYWISPDEKRPLAINLPPMPLELRLIIVGDRHRLATFKDIDSELSEQAIYGEYEDFLQLNEINDMSKWCGYINTLIIEQQLLSLAADAWPILLRNAVRYSGDQGMLPLSSRWITHQLKEAALYTKKNIITEHDLKAALSAQEWRESYLPECIQHEIALDQIMIETQGKVVGQVNGLSVVDYPGYPHSLGEPSRISCVVHFGDGEFTDVERKAELGGNLHAKGMMIIQAFLIAELQLNHQPTFSASIVFEQSYEEVDGDSASLAALCALISALAQKPICQQIAVTGSVDQFGNVKPIGAINEKIEGFFQVCLRQGLTGQQGIILPAANMRHLCLRQEVVDTVSNGQFHLWTVHKAAEALMLLTNYVYYDEQHPNLLTIMRERMKQMNTQEHRYWPWPLRWLNWLHQS